MSHRKVIDEFDYSTVEYTSCYCAGRVPGRKCYGAITREHVVPQQRIKLYVPPLGGRQVRALRDRRNLLGCCLGCHLPVFVASVIGWFVLSNSIAHARCYHHHHCWQRVRVARAKAWLWRHYKAHPLPPCTWERESGWPGLSAWAPRRYRARNLSSTAGGKFQILDQTWYGHGGRYHPSDGHVAAYAPPLEQERIARRVLADQGLGAWVEC